MDRFGGVANRPQSLHRYVYADSDPINKWDRTGLLADGSSAGVVTGMTISNTLAAIALVALPVIVQIGVRVLAPGEFAGGPNEMRVQLQQGRIHYTGRAVHPQMYTFVSKLDLELGLLVMEQDATASPNGFPYADNEDELQEAIIESYIWTKQVQHGVSSIGNVHRETWRKRGKEYRVDIENLRGTNLLR